LISSRLKYDYFNNMLIEVIILYLISICYFETTFYQILTEY
jgi:hypothetical protein